MIDLCKRAEIERLLLPCSDNTLDMCNGELGERDIMNGAKAYDAGNPVGTSGLIRRYGWDWLGSEGPDTRVIIIKHIHIAVWWVVRAVDARITGAQIARRIICGHIGERCIDALTDPRPILTVGSNNDPFLPKWMPALFPHPSCIVHHGSFCVMVCVYCKLKTAKCVIFCVFKTSTRLADRTGRPFTATIEKILRRVTCVLSS